jgi:hypothetical protein
MSELADEIVVGHMNDKGSLKNMFDSLNKKVFKLT